MKPDTLSATFAALADPTRRAILARLAQGEATVQELAEPFNMTLPAISKHLKVLERAGLIARGRQAQWRPSRLEASPLKEVADWVAQYRHVWEFQLDSLEAFLRDLQAKERTMTQMNTPTMTAAQEVTITRIFDAPRELVFKAWVDPVYLARWWGPRGYTNPVVELDARPGGRILIHMTAPDGTVYPNKGTFHEVVAPERLVFSGGVFEDEAGNPQLEDLTTVTFTEYNGKTQVTLHTIATKWSPEFEEALVGMEQGWQEGLDRLALNLAKRGSVLSKDGTRIAYDQVGEGTPIIMVTGALGVRSPEVTMDDLSSYMVRNFTVINYDRRGRGESGDTAPYAVQREVEDIEALIDHIGGSALLYGMSSGAVLALEVAAAMPGKVKKLAMYEPPFIIDDSRPPIPSDYVPQLNDAIAAGDRGKAVEIFMHKALLIPMEFVNSMRTAPMNELFPDAGMTPPAWLSMESVAHTLAYDGMIMGDTMSGKPLPAGKWATNTSSTLVITGGNSEEFFHSGAKALAADLPTAKHRVLEGQDHAVAPDALAPMLLEFFND